MPVAHSAVDVVPELTCEYDNTPTACYVYPAGSRAVTCVVECIGRDGEPTATTRCFIPRCRSHVEKFGEWISDAAYEGDVDPGHIVNPEWAPVFVNWRKCKGRHRKFAVLDELSPDVWLREWGVRRVSGCVDGRPTRVIPVLPTAGFVAFMRPTCAIAAEAHIRALKRELGADLRGFGSARPADVRRVWECVCAYTWGDDVEWERFAMETSSECGRPTGTRVISSPSFRKFFRKNYPKTSWKRAHPGFSFDDEAETRRVVRWVYARADAVCRAGVPFNVTWDVYHRGEFFVATTEPAGRRTADDQFITIRVPVQSRRVREALCRPGRPYSACTWRFVAGVIGDDRRKVYERSKWVLKVANDRLLAADRTGTSFEADWRVFMRTVETSDDVRCGEFDDEGVRVGIPYRWLSGREDADRITLRAGAAPQMRRYVEILPPSPPSNNIAIRMGVKGEGFLEAPLHWRLHIAAARKFFWEKKIATSAWCKAGCCEPVCSFDRLRKFVKIRDDNAESSAFSDKTLVLVDAGGVDEATKVQMVHFWQTYEGTENSVSLHDNVVVCKFYDAIQGKQVRLFVKLHVSDNDENEVRNSQI